MTNASHSDVIKIGHFLKGRQTNDVRDETSPALTEKRLKEDDYQDLESKNPTATPQMVNSEFLLKSRNSSEN